ncbi:MAG: hypothetical protein ACJAUE_002015 [Alcanivorax sp.]|jgi:hypothetical protein
MGDFSVIWPGMRFAEQLQASSGKLQREKWP